MKEKRKIKVSLVDKMVLTGIGLGAVYWIIDTFLCFISRSGSGFGYELVRPNLDELGSRIIVLCLFLIFGSHSQYTINMREEAEADREKMKDMIISLQEEINQLQKK